MATQGMVFPMSRYKSSSYADLRGRGLNLNTTFPRLAPEADDTGRLQRALNYAQSNNVKIILPAGNYNISSGLTWTAPNINTTVAFEGENPDGVSITATAAMTAMLSVIGGQNHKISGISFDLNNKATQGLYLDSNSANTNSQHYTSVENCIFHLENNTNSYGVYIGQYGTDVAQIKLYKCQFFSSAQKNTGLYLGTTNSKNYYVDFCAFSYFATGIVKGNAGILNIANCQFAQNTLDLNPGSCYVSLMGCGSEDSVQFIQGTTNQANITVVNSYWQTFNVTPNTDVISVGGNITLIGNIIQTNGAMHIQNTADVRANPVSSTRMGSITSIGNIYSCDLTTKLNTFFDGSNNNLTDVDDTGYIQSTAFNVVSMSDVINNPGGNYYKVDNVFSGNNVFGNAREYKGSAVPTTNPPSGTWKIGDQVRNTSPTAGGYMGWVCTTAGTACGTTWASGGTYTQGEQVAYNGNVYSVTVAGASTSTVAPANETTAGADGYQWALVGVQAVFKTYGTISA